MRLKSVFCALRPNSRDFCNISFFTAFDLARILTNDGEVAEDEAYLAVDSRSPRAALAKLTRAG
jgi:hypothetical protein